MGQRNCRRACKGSLGNIARMETGIREEIRRALNNNPQFNFLRKVSLMCDLRFISNVARRPWTFALALALVVALPAPTAQQEPKPRWLLAQAFHIPSEYTNQESSYFSIIEGHNGNIYVGTAKYGVNCFLIEFNPAKAIMRMVVDVHRAIMKFLKGFAAQAKLHTRNNVGASGKIYVGSKQGYPEKDEKRGDYPGGYVLTYDPKTEKVEHFGIA